MAVSKSILTITTLVFVGLFGGGLYLFTQAGVLAKGFLERTATETLGVQVSIDSVNVDLRNKAAAVKGLMIGNPEGFDKPYAMHVGQISAKLGDISKGLIIIESVDVSGADVNFEVTEKGTNIMTLKKGIKAKPAKKKMVSSGGVSEGGSSDVKVIIDRLKIGEIALHPSVNVAKGYEIAKDVTVPSLLLTEIGRRENGLLVHDAMAQVLGSVMKKINGVAGSAGLSPEALFKSVAEEKFDAVKDKLKSLF